MNSVVLIIVSVLSINPSAFSECDSGHLYSLVVWNFNSLAWMEHQFNQILACFAYKVVEGLQAGSDCEWNGSRQLKSDELHSWALQWNMRRRNPVDSCVTSDVELFRYDCKGLRELFLFIHPSISLLFVRCRQCITLKYKFPPPTSLPLQQFRLKATELLICKLHFIPNDIISTLRSQASRTLLQRPSTRKENKICNTSWRQR